LRAFFRAYIDVFVGKKGVLGNMQLALSAQRSVKLWKRQALVKNPGPKDLALSYP
jgi:hypothetical protein